MFVIFILILCDQAILGYSHISELVKRKRVWIKFGHVSCADEFFCKSFLDLLGCSGVLGQSDFFATV